RFRSADLLDRTHALGGMHAILRDADELGAAAEIEHELGEARTQGHDAHDRARIASRERGARDLERRNGPVTTVGARRIDARVLMLAARAIRQAIIRQLARRSERVAHALDAALERSNLPLAPELLGARRRDGEVRLLEPV